MTGWSACQSRKAMGDEDDKKEETPAVDGAKEKKQVGRPDCVTPKPDLEEKGDDPDVDEQ